LQNQTQQQLQAYPWIGDLPVVGSLFRSTAFQRGETELIILVTPYLVQPISSATALTTDNDGFYAPSDKDRVINGSLNSVPSKGPTAGKPASATSSATSDGPIPASRAPVPGPVALPAPAATPSATVEAKAAAPAGSSSPAPAVATATAAMALPPSPKAAAAPARSAATSGFEID
jgi:pilus assembly protein CpaC